MPDLNPEAKIKYGEVKQQDGSVLENYLIVIPETHEEIAAYELDFEFDAKSYSEICVENLLGHWIASTI